MRIREWIFDIKLVKNYFERRRNNLIRSLTNAEIEGTEHYKTISDNLVLERERTKELELLLETINTRAGDLERSVEGNKAAAMSYKKQSELSTKRNVELDNLLAGSRAETESYKSQLEKMRREYFDFPGNLGELEATIAKQEAERKKLMEQNGSLSEQVKNLGRLIKGKTVELALVRIGRGENPSNFNCPEAAGEIARENESLRREHNELTEERGDLMRELRRARSQSYESIFDNLEKSGFLDDNFSLLYINNEFNVSRVSDNFTNLFGYSKDDVVGKSIGSLRKILPKEFGRQLIEDWKDANERYGEVKIVGDKDLDILIQRADDKDGNPCGAFVYISRHNRLEMHSSHRKVLKIIDRFKKYYINF